jgi:hypothetical protein
VYLCECCARGVGVACMTTKTLPTGWQPHSCHPHRRRPPEQLGSLRADTSARQQTRRQQPANRLGWHKKPASTQTSVRQQATRQQAGLAHQISILRQQPARLDWTSTTNQHQQRHETHNSSRKSSQRGPANNDGNNNNKLTNASVRPSSRNRGAHIGQDY